MTTLPHLDIGPPYHFKQLNIPQKKIYISRNFFFTNGDEWWLVVHWENGDVNIVHRKGFV